MRARLPTGIGEYSTALLHALGGSHASVASSAARCRVALQDVLRRGQRSPRLCRLHFLRKLVVVWEGSLLALHQGPQLFLRVLSPVLQAPVHGADVGVVLDLAEGDVGPGPGARVVCAGPLFFSEEDQLGLLGVGEAVSRLEELKLTRVAGEDALPTVQVALVPPVFSFDLRLLQPTL